MIHNRKERTRFLRFAMVGTIGAAVDFGAFNLSIALLGIRAIAASAISFTLAVISNFLWNRYWTYPDSRSKPIWRQLIQFTIISVIGMGIRLGMFALFENPLIQFFQKQLPPTFLLEPVFLGHNLILAVAIGVVMLWNFFANRIWTYSDIDE